jgi:hypothetical protein
VAKSTFATVWLVALLAATGLAKAGGEGASGPSAVPSAPSFEAGDPEALPILSDRPGAGGGFEVSEESAAMSPAANTRMSDDPGIYPQDEPYLAHDGAGNIVMVWQDARSQGLYGCAYTVSHDGGRTWDPNRFYGPSPSFMDQSGDAVAGSDAGGTLYRGCLVASSNGGALTRIDVAASRDGGRSWSQAVNVAAGVGNQYTSHDKEWVAGGGPGVAHVAWAVFGMSGACQSEIYYTKSSDYGATWSTATQMPNTCNGQGAFLIEDVTGAVHFSWWDYQTSTLRYQRSGDGGASWGSPLTLGPTGSFSKQDQPRAPPIPAMAVDPTGKRVLVTWTENTSAGKKDVLAAFSGDGGLTFAPHVSVASTSLREFQPAVTFVAFGEIVVQYSVIEPGGSQQMWVEERRSSDGSTWSAPSPVTDRPGGITSFAGDYKGVLPYGNGTISVWTDTRDSSQHGTDIYASVNGSVSQGGISKVEVRPSEVTLTVDQTAQFTATALDQNGNPVPATFAWSASGGSVSPAGVYTPGPLGSFRVTATSGGKSGSALAYVTAGAPTALEVTPQSATLKSGESLRFRAEGRDAKGNSFNLTNATWSASAGSIDASGLYVAGPPGTHTATAAAWNGVKGTATVTVNADALSRIVVSPSRASIKSDATVKFGASGEDAGGNPVPVRVVWAATGGSIAQDGVYTPGRAGVFTVYANDSSVSGSAIVEVAPGPPASVGVEPTSATVKADESLKLSARVEDAKGNVVPKAQIEWASTGGAVSSVGMFTPALAGRVTIFANASGVSGSATVTVLPGRLATLEVRPAFVKLRVGEKVKFSATPNDSKGNAVTDVEILWSVEGRAGTVDEDGEFSGNSAGRVKVVVEASQGRVVRYAEAVAEVEAQPLIGGGSAAHWGLAAGGIAAVLAVALLGLAVRRRPEAAGKGKGYRGTGARATSANDDFYVWRDGVDQEADEEGQVAAVSPAPLERGERGPRLSEAAPLPGGGPMRFDSGGGVDGAAGLPPEPPRATHLNDFG